LEGKVQEGRRYESVEDLSEDQGRLIYIAKQKDKMFVVVDGQEQMQHDRDPKSWNQNIKTPKIVNGKLAYVLDLGTSAALFYDGKEIDRVDKSIPYSGGIDSIGELNGELVYMISDGGSNKRAVLGNRTIVADPKLQFIDCNDGRFKYLSDGKWHSEDGKEIPK